MRDQNMNMSKKKMWIKLQNVQTIFDVWWFFFLRSFAGYFCKINGVWVKKKREKEDEVEEEENSEKFVYMDNIQWIDCKRDLKWKLRREKIKSKWKCEKFSTTKNNNNNRQSNKETIQVYTIYKQQLHNMQWEGITTTLSIIRKSTLALIHSSNQAKCTCLTLGHPISFHTTQPKMHMQHNMYTILH